ncbi:FtsX-like permease family protein [Streptomyces sp. NPDC048507]|uniref:ABC transporter permease n=1 Tax=Streptomyces sp. NPDC048507 TaxID=3365560 RepID=UPI00371F4752
MLILANVRAHRSGFLGAFIAVLLGTALITTTLVLYDSSRPTVGPRYAATAALALAPQALGPDGGREDRIPWSPAEARSLAARLDGLPSVAAVVMDRSFYAQAVIGDAPVADEAALEAGHGWDSARMAPHRLVSGRPPATDREVVVDQALGAAMNSELTVNITTGRERFTVVGTVDGPGYYFSEAFAAARQPGVRAIGLIAERGASAPALAARAQKALGRAATVVTGDARSALQPAYIEHKRFLGVQLVTAMAVLALFTTVFVVASLLVLATGMRRREIGLLRTIGAGPDQIRRMILGEAAVVGALGSIAGALTGLAATPLLRAVMRDLDVTPPDLTITITAWPLLTACAIGAGVSVIGAWAAGRKAARVAPIEALLERRSVSKAMGRGRWAAALTALGAGAALAVGTATTGADDRINTAILATMTLIVAAALLAPALVGPLGRALTAPFGRSAAAAPVLLRAELLAHPRRAASLVAPVIAAVGFAVLLSGIVETMRVAYPAGEALKVAGQTIVTPHGTPGNTDEVVTANPVGKAALPTRAFVAAAADGVTVLDVLGTRDQRWNTPGEAVLGERTARQLGLTQGESVAVRFADGASVTLRVGAVLPDDPARGDFVVARELVRAHDPAALNDDVFVPDGARASGAVPGTALHDAAEYALADYRTDARLTDSLAGMLMVIAVGYSAIAVVNSTAMAAHGRRRDLAVLGSAGGTARQLLLLAAGEAAMVVTVGAALGILVTLPPLAAMASGLSQATSADVGLHLDTAAVVRTVTGTLLAATAAAVTVTWRTLRSRTA